jgi:hypothetical protein
MLLTLLRDAAAGAGVSGAHTVLRRASRQPTGALALDWDSSLLREVRAVIVFNNGIGFDLIRNRQLGYSGTAVPSVNPLGNERALFLEQSTVPAATLPSTDDLNITGEVSVLYRFSMTSASTVGAHFGKGNGNGTSNTPFAVDFTTGYIRSIRSNAGFRYFDGAGVPNDTLNTVLVAAPAGIENQPNFYANGRPLANIGSAGSGTSTPTTNTNALRVGSRIDIGVRQTGFAHLAIVWARQFADGEAREITRQPWQILRRRSVTLYSIPGAGGTPGNATGTTLTATLSLTTGAATGAAAAAGATLTATTSLVAGVATGAASAAGVTLTDTLSFIPGAATVGGAGNAAGVTLTATTSLLAGAATGAASAAGTTITATLSLIPGAASAGVLAAGVTLTATASFTAGAATGAAAAAGRVLTSALSFTPGFATGGGLSSAPGAQITVAASLITGTAETFPTSDTPSRIRIGGRVMNDTTRIGSFVMRKNNRPIRH